MAIRFDPQDWKLFVELPYFQAKWASLGLNDVDLRSLQLMLTADPVRGPLMRGTGGLRKVRFRSERSNVGKSGSYRVGYAYFAEHGVIALIAVFAKKDQGNFSAVDRQEIKRLIEQLNEWVSRGGR